MNANELADELEIAQGNNNADELIPNAIAMLRQQQAEIEALKAEIVSIEKNTDYWADKGNWIRNNEPVAELVLEQMAVGDASSLRVKWLIDGYPPVGTKLYTHPVKQLSDEEIEEIIRKHWNREYGNRNMMTFARAIIKEITE